MCRKTTLLFPVCGRREPDHSVLECSTDNLILTALSVIVFRRHTLGSRFSWKLHLEKKNRNIRMTTKKVDRIWSPGLWDQIM